MPITNSPERHRFSAVIAFATAAVLCFAGCAPSVSDREADNKNRAVWKMPVDEFLVYSVELDNYAEQLLIAECVTAQGYQWPVPWQDVNFQRAEDFNPLGVRLFTPALARRWGYHFARLENEGSAKLWNNFSEITDAYFPNADLDKALLGCRERVRANDQEFSRNVEGQNYLAELSTQAQQVVEQDADVVEATSAWRRCLIPQVSFTVPENPWTEMPPFPIAERWGAVTGGTPHASAEEIAAAVADAECRESSGLAELAYEKNWEEQVKLVEKNRDKLDGIRADAIERREYLLTIVAENAPAAP